VERDIVKDRGKQTEIETERDRKTGKNDQKNRVKPIENYVLR
jgi:hypothetical protein